MRNRYNGAGGRESGDNLICLVHNGDLRGAAFIDVFIGVGIDSNWSETRDTVVAWLTVDDEQVPGGGDESGGGGDGGC